MGDSAYSFSLTTFSPQGKLMQIEHALNAVKKKGKTAIGIVANNGVVLATTKKLPPLVDAKNVHKVSKVTNGVGVVYAGLGPDYRVLLSRARKRAQVYYRKYQDDIPVLQLTRQTAQVMQEFTQQGGVRPFGVSLLIAGFDEEGPQLFQADPSGAYFQWKATAIGEGFMNAKSFLEKRFSDDWDHDIDYAIDQAILCLKNDFEGEMTEHNIEIGIVEKDDDGKTIFRLLPAEDVRTAMDNLA
mmetsp:Transcript_15456/g.19140  ORF Transcript_15456/g.19140 Transcript_15456/m.19140 type:complete len:242 (-) Transcript_15456:1066-1791(-)